MVTKSCIGRTCTAPWKSLHSSGNVHTLSDSLAPEFNEYYISIAEKVSFDKCELGYIPESEGPQKLPDFETWNVDLRQDGGKQTQSVGEL
jgi:N-acetylglucosamine-6-sulfatase